MKQIKVRTYEFYYTKKDHYGVIQFVASSKHEATLLFEEWCRENHFETDYDDVRVVYNKYDADEYGSRYEW